MSVQRGAAATARRAAPWVAVAMAAALTASCTGGRGGSSGQSGARGGVTMENGGVVLTGATLEDGRGNVLSTMQGKVPGFRYRRQRGECPRITLRNNVSYGDFGNPHVYVDGTRATDTCILDSVRTEDVERVEVYALGVTTRAGYATHPYGLILLFMRGGDWGGTR